ncbi:hypothetical protein [Duganella sp.]|uniref:hypothetical protein n=1 Tax=Duganella sp. TaxID=1904440 RepID=UPI0031D64E4A
MLNPLTDYMLPRPRYVGPAICCCIAMLGFSVWVTTQAYMQYQQRMRINLRYEALLAAQVVLPPPKINPSELEDQKKWLALKAERDFAWSAIFSAIERASSKEIELLEFVPAKQEFTMSLRGEAHDTEALIDFLAALSRQPALQAVHLTRQKKKVRGALETIEFELHGTIIH